MFERYRPGDSSPPQLSQAEPQQSAADLRSLIDQLETIARHDPHRSGTCGELLSKLRSYAERTRIPPR